MPTIKFSEVLSFSSEDPNHPADNLLRQETHRKWKCAAGLSEKQASVTLKLERLTAIRSIDIGNAGSAFVEVLAAREDANFKVLLVASSFMTPIESRNASDLHRVRMFGPDKLNKDVASQKWDRIKVVCTQPFNKNLQYGLSFVTLSSAADEATPTTPKNIKLGSFTLKEEEDADPISIGSVFARRKEKDASSSPLSGAAAIRAASVAAVTTATAAGGGGGGGGGGSSPGPGSLKRKAQENPPDVGFYQLKKRPSNDTPESKNRERDKPKFEKEGSNTERKNTTERKEEKEKKKMKEREKGGGESSSSSGKNRDRRKEVEEADKETKREIHKKKREGSTGREGKRERENPPTTSTKKQRKSEPFASLMKDVVFVMSGYQNPQRSNLRDMMLDMGASYKQDWDPSCSHLICAFTNTPKFQQVKGKGKIVTAKWITDCHKNKIRYPWRRYQLERGRSEDESEEEVWAEELLPKDESRAKSPSTQRQSSSAAGAAGDDGYDMATDSGSEEDTDDEIERVLAKKKKMKERENGAVESQQQEEEKARRKDRNGKKEETPKKPAPRRREREEEEEEMEEDGEEERLGKTASGKARGESAAKRAKMGTSGDETKKTVNGRKASPNVDSRETQNGGKVTDRKKMETNGLAEGDKGRQEHEEEEDKDYDADTDVDEDKKKYLQPPDTSALPLPPLADHFSGKTFFIYGRMDERVKKMVRRYIVAFNG
ncbi:DNA repair protein XRCC1-like isoform X2 [Penaeus japonicus]|uniref:DNA repair protein XRCC1-like isoform X2 n=1 Tax=Penaeus japonicus TaxID=27405 RepID=UPI001C71323B|nr:DNA repair protein XRCC1-like isoform X2 [Penaeus japonicus]